jgi:hypothetical protein
MSDVRYLRAPAAAEFLHENFGHGSVRSLAKLRSLGGGPKFHKIGSKIVATRSQISSSGPRRKSAPRGPRPSTEGLLEPCPNNEKPRLAGRGSGTIVLCGEARTLREIAPPDYVCNGQRFCMAWAPRRWRTSFARLKPVPMSSPRLKFTRHCRPI